MLFHGIYVLNKKPLIVALWGDDAWDTLIRLNIKPDIFIWHCAWNRGTISRMAKLKLKFHQLKTIGIRPLLVANSHQEDVYRKLFGIEGFKSSAYVFVDENDYSIQSSQKKYKAVYSAQLSDFKRIPLAKDVDSLYVMTYKRGVNRWNLHEEYPEMLNADYNDQWLDVQQKNQLLSESSVGLCLSKEEGPMLASLEYMLNGLPVVSTPSKGGRQDYYDDSYCRIVPAKPELISKAVYELANLGISPTQIRQRTIEKLNEDRNRYISFLIAYLHKNYNLKLEHSILIEKWFLSPKKNFVSLDNLDKSQLLK